MQGRGPKRFEASKVIEPTPNPLRRTLYDEPRSGGKPVAAGGARYERNPGVTESLCKPTGLPSARVLRFMSGRNGLMARRASAAYFLWPDAPFRCPVSSRLAGLLISLMPTPASALACGRHGASRMSPLTRLVSCSVLVVYRPRDFRRSAVQGGLRSGRADFEISEHTSVNLGGLVPDHQKDFARTCASV